MYGAAGLVQPFCAAMAAQMVEQPGQGVAVAELVTEGEREADVVADGVGWQVCEHGPALDTQSQLGVEQPLTPQKFVHACLLDNPR